MDPKIVTEPEWLVVGMSFYGDPFSRASGWSEENEIGLLWQRFMAFLGQKGEAIKHIVSPNMALEIHIETAETREKGLLEVFVGVRVARLEATPVECVVKVLPATRYAVFTLQGRQITSDWGRLIYRDWLPGAGYSAAHNYLVQRYDERFKGMDNIEESTLEAYVPVKKGG